MEDILALECALRCVARSPPVTAVQEAVQTPLKRTGKSGKAVGLQSVGNLFMGKCSKKTCSGGQKNPS